jgi:hypothetical protein
MVCVSLILGCMYVCTYVCTEICIDVRTCTENAERLRVLSVRSSRSAARV